VVQQGGCLEVADGGRAAATGMAGHGG